MKKQTQGIEERHVFVNLVGDNPSSLILRAMDEGVLRIDVRPETWLDGFVDGISFASGTGITLGMLTGTELWGSTFLKEHFMAAMDKHDTEYVQGVYEGIKRVKEVWVLKGEDVSENEKERDKFRHVKHRKPGIRDN